MKPPRFAYRQAGSADEAVSHLAEHGDDAKVLAGGQSLMPLLNMRLAQPGVIVDISRARDLQDVWATSASIRYGAAVVHRRFEDGDVPDPFDGLLRTAAAGIGYRAIRNRGTLGGSLAHADSSAEWPVVMAAVDATVHTRSGSGERQVPAREFVEGFFTNVLTDDELIVGVAVPVPAIGLSWGLHKAARKVGEFSESLGVVLLRWSPGGTVSSADVWLGAARDVPLRVPDLEAMLVGGNSAPDLADIAAATRTVLDDADTIENRYRCHLHAVTVQRALTDAMTRRAA